MAAIRVTIAIAVAIGAMLLFDQISSSDVRNALPTLFDGGQQDATLRFGAMGITLGSAVAGWVEAILLWRLADKAIPGVSPLRPIKALIPALIGAGVVAILMRIVTDDMWPPLAMILSVGLSGLTYLIICWVLRIPALNVLLGGPLRKLRR